MEVFGIGPFEIALIVLVAFIVLGPERIPGAMRQLGTWVRRLREMTNNLTRDYGSDIQQLTGELTALQEEFRSIQRELGQVATGFMTPPIEGTPPARSGTAAPVDPIEPRSPEDSQAIVQSLTDNIKRASKPPAPPPAATETDPDDTYTI